MGQSEPPHFTAPEPRAYDAWDARWIAEVVGRAAFPDAHLKLRVNSGDARADEGGRLLWTVELDGGAVGSVALMSLDAPVWASPAYAVEVDLTAAVVRARREAAYRPLPATPPAELDVALIVPDAISAETVEEAIRRLGGDILERATLFDEFRGAGVEAGTRSLAWRLTFRHPERTLRDQEVEARRETLITALQRELGVRPRAS